jgi:hypothetical protein
MSAHKSPILRPKQVQRPEDADVRSGSADFSDPHSQRVLDSAAHALIEVLARQAARECFARLVATEDEPR